DAAAGGTSGLDCSLWSWGPLPSPVLVVNPTLPAVHWLVRLARSIAGLECGIRLRVTEATAMPVGTCCGWPCRRHGDTYVRSIGWNIGTGAPVGGGPSY